MENLVVRDLFVVDGESWDRNLNEGLLLAICAIGKRCDSCLGGCGQLQQWDQQWCPQATGWVKCNVNAPVNKEGRVRLWPLEARCHG
ncbi:hypothetical protein GOBAR_DD12452 [Gossypium barbadense]|nr:hypothetical protein GOBAR_DD12452 [Gossypium barbadense]